MAYFDFIYTCAYASLRTCNNQEDLGATSSSPKVKVDLLRLLLRQAMQVSRMILPTTICMPE